jgi:hypothetical protein
MNKRVGKETTVIFGVNSSNGSVFQRAGFKKNKIMSGDYSTVSSTIQRSSFKQKLFHLITASLRLSKTGVVLPQIRHETVNSPI